MDIMVDDIIPGSIIESNDDFVKSEVKIDPTGISIINIIFLFVVLGLLYLKNYSFYLKAAIVLSMAVSIYLFG